MTKKEIYKCLRDKIPPDQEKTEHINHNHHQAEDKKPKQEKKYNKKEIAHKEELKKTLLNLTGTRAAYLFDKNMKVIGKIPVKEMFGALREIKDIYALIFDGSVDQKLVNFAKDKNIRYVVGMKIIGRITIPNSMEVLTQKDFS